MIEKLSKEQRDHLEHLSRGVLLREDCDAIRAALADLDAQREETARLKVEMDNWADPHGFHNALALSKARIATLEAEVQEERAVAASAALHRARADVDRAALEAERDALLAWLRTGDVEAYRNDRMRAKGEQVSIVEAVAHAIEHGADALRSAKPAKEGA